MLSRSPTIVGVNLPWLLNGYGHDLGGNQAYPSWPEDFNPGQTSRLLETVHGFGVRCLRFWLFEDGEGLLYDDAGRVTGVDPLFLRNLRKLIEIAMALDMTFYWVLIDANSVRRRPDMVTRMILTQGEHAQRFFDFAVRPLLPLIGPIAWAVELCNEPEAMVRGDYGNGTGLGFRWPDVVPSLNLLARAIRRELSGVALSVGSGFQEHRNVAIGHYHEVDIDAVDFHSHCHEAALPATSELSKKRPVIIGELGFPIPCKWPRDRRSWEEVQRRLVVRLDEAIASGAVALFLWFLGDPLASDPEALAYEGAPGAALQALPDLQRRGRIAAADQPVQTLHQICAVPVQRLSSCSSGCLQMPPNGD